MDEKEKDLTEVAKKAEEDRRIAEEKLAQVRFSNISKFGKNICG